jgi:hypothetical protein
MPRHKPSPAAKSSSPFKSTPRWKVVVIICLFGILLLGALGSMGVFKGLNPGPNIPLPREAGQFSFGTTYEDILRKYPTLKKKMRRFNADPFFAIATLDAKDNLAAATSVDLLFYKNQLYFVSAMWEGAATVNAPVPEWAKQYRRWTQGNGGNPESLGAQVLLKEWRFKDKITEMTLRDLNYPERTQRWQDIRDAANLEAQAAFAKYRLEATN